MTKNIILMTDSYKTSHYLQYPEGTTQVYSYIESRGGEFDKTVFFGLQAFIKEYLLTPITKEDIDEAEEVITAHGLTFNRSGWEYILNVHGGKLPVIIRAAEEGAVIPTRNVLVSINNLDDNVPWLTSYLETALLRAIWYPTSVATLSYEIKQAIKEALEYSSDVPAGEQIGFKLHDFGARGVSSGESAMLGGMGHLLSFQGTDNIEAIMGARKYYHCDMAGFSIPASEHSTITVWKQENEDEAFENMIDKFDGVGKIFACVSDSYNIYEAIKKLWGGTLKEKVKKLKGTLVVRPDSGNPTIVPVECIEKLMDVFGYSVNSKGYCVLPSYVRVIQGDGINIDSIKTILNELKIRKISAENIAFGMGGALLQGPNRDSQKFAMKASHAFVNGQGVDVFKDPIHDKGKASKKGMLYLTHNRKTGEYNTYNEEQYGARSFDLVLDQDLALDIVYVSGELMRDMSFSQIRLNTLKGN